MIEANPLAPLLRGPRKIGAEHWGFGTRHVPPRQRRAVNSVARRITRKDILPDSDGSQVYRSSPVLLTRLQAQNSLQKTEIRRQQRGQTQRRRKVVRRGQTKTVGAVHNCYLDLRSAGCSIEALQLPGGHVSCWRPSEECAPNGLQGGKLGLTQLRPISPLGSTPGSRVEPSTCDWSVISEACNRSSLRGSS